MWTTASKFGWQLIIGSNMEQTVFILFWTLSFPLIFGFQLLFQCFSSSARLNDRTSSNYAKDRCCWRTITKSKNEWLKMITNTNLEEKTNIGIENKHFVAISASFDVQTELVQLRVRKLILICIKLTKSHSGQWTRRVGIQKNVSKKLWRRRISGVIKRCELGVNEKLSVPRRLPAVVVISPSKSC